MQCFKIHALSLFQEKRRGSLRDLEPPRHRAERSIEEYLETADSSDKYAFFRGFIERYLERSSKARERHAVTLNDTRYFAV